MVRGFCPHTRDRFVNGGVEKGPQRRESGKGPQGYDFQLEFHTEVSPNRCFVGSFRSKMLGAGAEGGEGMVMVFSGTSYDT